MNNRIEKRIAEVRDEIARLEAKQALYRRVIGPQAAALVTEWRATLNAAEHNFMLTTRRRVEEKRVPTLDLNGSGIEAFFCRDLFEERLAELAYFAVGNQAMHEYDRFSDGYVPVGPELAARRAELEALNTQRDALGATDEPQATTH